MTGGERVAEQALSVPLKRRVRCCWPSHARHNQYGYLIGPVCREHGTVRIKWEQDGTTGEILQHEWTAAR